MKIYTLQVVIREGNDEFWESLGDRSGCDEVVDVVKEALETNGFLVGPEEDCQLTLVKYEAH